MFPKLLSQTAKCRRRCMPVGHALFMPKPAQIFVSGDIPAGLLEDGIQFVVQDGPAFRQHPGGADGFRSVHRRKTRALGAGHLDWRIPHRCRLLHGMHHPRNIFIPYGHCPRMTTPATLQQSAWQRPIYMKNRQKPVISPISQDAPVCCRKGMGPCRCGNGGLRGDCRADRSRGRRIIQAAHPGSRTSRPGNR